MNTLSELRGELLDLLAKFREALMVDLKVATIAIVTDIDNKTGLLTVKPAINERIVLPNGSTTWQEAAEIPDTPYINPLGIAPKKGAAVLLVFCDQDISGWLPTTGATVGGAPAPQNQQILRRHDHNNAVAVVGLINSSLSTSKTAYKASSTFALSGENIPASKADLGGGFSGALVKWLELWEGLPDYALDWYDDGFGNWTIGYGHMNMARELPAGYTAPMTPETAESLLVDYDIPIYAGIADAAFPGKTFTINQKDALTSFAFATGGFSRAGTLVGLINDGVTDDRLLSAFQAWGQATDPDDGVLKPIKELQNRFATVYSMYVSGTYITREGATIG